MDQSQQAPEELEAKIIKETLLRRKLYRRLVPPKPAFRLPYSAPNQDLDYLLQLCGKELAERPNSQQGLFIRASVFLKREQYAEAITDCNALLIVNPQHAGAFYVRGCAYERSGRLDLSFADFSTALALDPTHVSAAFAKATCQNKMGNLDQAIEDYCSALELDLFQASAGALGSVKTPSISTTNCSESASVEGLASPSNTSSKRYSRTDSVPARLSTATSPPPLRVRVDLRTRSTVPSDQQADFYYFQGCAERKQKDFAAAVRSFDRVLALQKTHIKALFSKAFCLEKLELVDYATATYTEVLRIDPQCAIAYYNRGITYEKSGNLEKALSDFDKAVSLDQSRPDFYHNRGLVLKKLKNMEKAIEDFSNAVRTKTDHWKSLLNRAHCYETIGDRAKAIDDYARVLVYDPENQAALQRLADLLAKVGRPEDSLACCSRLVSVAPTPDFYVLRAHAFERLGRRAEALSDFNAAIDLERDNPLSWAERGAFLVKDTKFPEAISDLSRALELDPHDAKSYASRAQAYRKLERFSQAIADYSSEIQHSQPTMKSLSFRGYCEAKIGRFEEAVRDFTEVVKLDPMNINALYNRGISLYRLGEHRRVRTRQAVADFTKVIAADEFNSTALFHRGCCYEALKELDKSIEDYTRALELESGRESNCTSKDFIDLD